MHMQMPEANLAATVRPTAASLLERLHPDLLLKIAGMLPFADRRAFGARIA